MIERLAGRSLYGVIHQRLAENEATLSVDFADVLP